MYLTDTQIDELATRHEQEKTKVNSFVKNSGKRPVNFNNGTTDIMSDNIGKPQKQPVDAGRSKILEQYDSQQKGEVIHTLVDDDDDQFNKLMERHNEEKQKVNTFDNDTTHNHHQQEINQSYDPQDDVNYGFDNDQTPYEENLLST